MEETFRKVLHRCRVEWTTAPRSKRKAILGVIASVDSDAVVKMKTAVRMAVRKLSSFEQEDAEDFYEFCDSWVKEFGGSAEVLNVYEKAAVIIFANAVKP